jgi:hypothetical protein
MQLEITGMSDQYRRGEDRLRRRQAFATFARFAESYFKEIASADEGHASLVPLYSFYIRPGGRWGGHDPNIVDVFYGARPVAEQAVIDEETLHLRKRLVPESGAQLTYQMLLGGRVACLLYPAKAVELEAAEQMIVLEVIREPWVLTGTGTLKRHWKYFRSYMEVTSVDGEPSFMDSLRVQWLRYTKTSIVDGKTREGRFKQDVMRFLSLLPFFIFAVGFSGWILKLYDVFWAAPPPAQ